MPEKKKIILTRIIFAAALLGITPMFGGIGTALGLWEPMTGFRMTMNYYNISIISSLIVLYLVIKHFITDVTQSICTFLVLIIFLGAGYLLGINKEAPDITGLRGIHDVTTDMENPPEFIALLDASSTVAPIATYTTMGPLPWSAASLCCGWHGHASAWAFAGKAQGLVGHAQKDYDLRKFMLSMSLYRAIP